MTKGGGDFNIKWGPAGDGLDGRFQEVYIKAELWKKGKDLDLPMEISEIIIEPQGIIDVSVDEARSTPDTAVLRAELSKAVLTDLEFYDKVAKPVQIEIVAKPIAEQTAAAITAGSTAVSRKGTGGGDHPQGENYLREDEQSPPRGG